MSRRAAVVIAVVLLCGVTAVGQAQESEPVRINVKEDLIEISLSRDSWWLAHGWATVRLDAVVGMTEEQVRTLLLQHYLFELTVDGVAVTASEITLDPGAEGTRWILAWRYDRTFELGLHTLVGTWSISGIPCTYLDEGDCDSPSVDDLPSFWTVLQPPTVIDGLYSRRQQHTLTLSVLP